MEMGQTRPNMQCKCTLKSSKGYSTSVSTELSVSFTEYFLCIQSMMLDCSSNPVERALLLLY